MNEASTSPDYHAALGHDLQDLPPLTIRIDAAYQRGLVDANHNDEFSINPERPTLRDTSVIARLKHEIETVVNKHRHSIELQDAWVREAAAEHTRMVLHLARKHRERDTATAGAAALTDKADALELARSAPRGEAKRGWGLGVLVIVAALIADLVLNYAALGPVLADSAVMTWAAVAAVTLMQIVIVWHLGGAKREKRDAGYWAAWAAVLVVTVGIAMLRYAGGIAIHELQRGLALDLENPSDYSAPWWPMKFAFLCFSMLGLLIIAGTFLESRKMHREAELIAIHAAHERASSAEDSLTAAAAARVSAEQKVRDTINTMQRLKPQAKAAIRAAGATCLLELEAWYRGMAEGLGDAALTANLDARYAAAIDDLADDLDAAVEAGLAELDDIPLGMADRERLLRAAFTPSVSGQEQTGVPDIPPTPENMGPRQGVGNHATLSLISTDPDEDDLDDGRLP